MVDVGRVDFTQSQSVRVGMGENPFPMEFQALLDNLDSASFSALSSLSMTLLADLKSYISKDPQLNAEIKNAIHLLTFMGSIFTSHQIVPFTDQMVRMFMKGYLQDEGARLAHPSAEPYFSFDVISMLNGLPDMTFTVNNRAVILEVLQEMQDDFSTTPASYHGLPVPSDWNQMYINDIKQVLKGVLDQKDTIPPEQIISAIQVLYTLVVNVVPIPP